MSLSRESIRRETAPGRRSRRVRDLILYVVIGVAFAVVLWEFGFHATSREAIAVTLKWAFFAGVTAIVLGEAIHRNRRLWRSRRFWLLLGAFGAVQSVLGIVLLWGVPKVPAIYWGLLLPLNYILLDKYLSLCLDSKQG